MNCPYSAKICTKCKELLIVCELNFTRRKDSKDGFRNECKRCKTKYNKQYREEHKEELTEKKKQYYEENKEEILEKQKEYYEENKEEILIVNKQYREKHKEVLAEKRKEYYEENKEELAEKQKEYYEENKEYILERNKKYREEHKEEISEKKKEWYEEHKDNVSRKNKQYHEENPHISFNAHNKRRQLKENQGRDITKEQWYEMFNFFDWKCAYSGEYIGGNNADKKRTTDHIICLNNGGLNEPWNCVPMLKSYNSSKHTNDMEEWYRQQPYFSEERLLKIYAWCEYAFNKWKPRRKGNKLRRVK